MSEEDFDVNLDVNVSFSLASEEVDGKAAEWSRLI